MKFYYGEYDGEAFPTQDSLFEFDNLMDFVMQHGEDALDALQQMMKEMPDSANAEAIEQMIKEGMLEKDGKGKLRLTPRAVTKMQHKALMEVFGNLERGNREGHEKVTTGAGGERVEGVKKYQYGDAVSELDVHETLRSSLKRHGLPADLGSGGRIKFDEQDFQLHQHQGTSNCSTVILLDLSGSMMRYGRYLSSKKVAMAMQALVRGRFPQDTLDFVGFYSGAGVIPESQLPLVMPKPVTIYDHQVRLRCPIEQIDKAPQHFTNLHLGLQIARRLLRKRGGDNRQIFIITDGQPTAHVEGNEIFLLSPPDPRSTAATLKEALLATREGCRISTFALVEDYWGMDWVGFVDRLTQLTKGVAFYTASGELSNCVMESYLSGRKKKSFIG
ncbi:MAG: VWA domain-containing protein [Phycisphaerae bacterium]